ncbi:MAG: HNH endonuclease [Acidimicrobiia bacterium]|nr:HNH endonuclease [Acidimicrobiia bacterium]
MESRVVDPDLSLALDAIHGGLDALFGAGVEPVDARDAIACIHEIERCARRLDAARADLLEHIDGRSLHRADGHSSAKTMLRHEASLSTAEAAGCDKTRRVMHELPVLGAAYRAGEVSTSHVRLLGRVHANSRVRAAMGASERQFVDRAQSLRYRDFELVVRRWERLADADGTCDRNERVHATRDFRLTQNLFELSWELSGGCAALQGAAMHEVFEHYLLAEWEADWEKARADHGDDACLAHLPRTPAQRRADALWQIFQDAASTSPDATAPAVVHNIVWSAETYEAMLSAMETDSSPELEADTHRCSTIDGVPLDPTEAVAASLGAHVRRVITDSAGTVIDLGRKARLFTGSARHAVLLHADRCIWPGCHRPASQCEVDHLHPYGQGGSTDPGNGAPLCGRHNRWKQKGFSTWRDPAGNWHTARSDGSEITPAAGPGPDVASPVSHHPQTAAAAGPV